MGGASSLPHSSLSPPLHVTLAHRYGGPGGRYDDHRRVGFDDRRRRSRSRSRSRDGRKRSRSEERRAHRQKEEEEEVRPLLGSWCWATNLTCLPAMFLPLQIGQLRLSHGQLSTAGLLLC